MIKSFIITLLLPLSLIAQTDEKAAGILKKASASNGAYSDITVSFNYTLENKDAGVNDSRTGELTLLGNKFHLRLMGQDIYSDGKIVWYVMKEDKEVHIKSVEEFKEETDLDPAKLFSQYDKGFKPKFHAEETVAGKKLSVIDLFPEAPGSKPYSRIRLAVDNANQQIVYSKTFGKDGTNYQLDVTSWKSNSGVDAKNFVFDQAKFEKLEYDVVDFR